MQSQGHSQWIKQCSRCACRLGRISSEAFGYGFASMVLRDFPGLTHTLTRSRYVQDTFFWAFNDCINNWCPPSIFYGYFYSPKIYNKKQQPELILHFWEEKWKFHNFSHAVVFHNCAETNEMVWRAVMVGCMGPPRTHDWIGFTLRLGKTKRDVEKKRQNLLFFRPSCTQGRLTL